MKLNIFALVTLLAFASMVQASPADTVNSADRGVTSVDHSGQNRGAPPGGSGQARDNGGRKFRGEPNPHGVRPIPHCACGWMDKNGNEWFSAENRPAYLNERPLAERIRSYFTGTPSINPSITRGPHFGIGPTPTPERLR